MSHAADTSDFERFFKKPAPVDQAHPVVNEPVMFLLESPGADYDNGCLIHHSDFPEIAKKPPVNGYYWMPYPDGRFPEWPIRDEEVAHTYGPYFAYLIGHFNLRNAYITNVVKCGLWNEKENSFLALMRASGGLRDKIVANCYHRFLSREIKELEPAIIFAFGQDAQAPAGHCGLSTVRLLHPADRHSRDQFIARNNKTIETALQGMITR